MSEFFRALEQAGRDRQEQLAKQRNAGKPAVSPEPPAQPEPEVPVVKASKPRTESRPVVAAKPTPRPEPEAAAVVPTSAPRNEPRPVVAVEPPVPAHVEPAIAAEPEIAVATAVVTEPEPEIDAIAPEIHAEVEPEIYTELEPEIYAEVEPEFHAHVEPAIHIDIEPEFHAHVEPAIHAEVEPEIYTELEPEIYAEVEPEIHVHVEPEIRVNAAPAFHFEAAPQFHAEVEAAVHTEIEPEIRAEVEAQETELETEAATENAVAMPFAMRAPDAPAFTENVPTAKDDDSESVDDRLVTLLTPNSFAGEQYRTLRHLVEKMHTETGVSVVGVSSPSIGDGKTTTAINLAGALSQARDTKVLLIDMDLRRPAVSGQLGIRGFSPKGVVAVLGAGASLDEVIVELPMFNLSIIPSGPRQSAPYELLKSSRLHQMIDEARRRFDYVIVDTPPVIAVPDCRVISSGVDGFLIIVNAHKTPTRLLSETVSVLGQSKVLGLVFNRDDQPIAEHLYNSYGPDPNAGWTGSIRRRLRRSGHGNGDGTGNGNGNGFLTGNGISH